MVTTKYFPFVMGLDQTTDDRLLEPGRPRAIENLAIRKKGRLGMRYDYDALSMVTQIGGTLTLFDLASYEGRLLGFGQNNDPFGNGVYSPTAPQTVLEFLGEPLYAWHGTDPAPDPQLSLMSNIRDIARVPRRTSIVAMDVAAGNGLVCLVYELGADTFVHVLDAAKDSTVLAQTLVGHSKPRVVCTGTKFFIGGVEGTTPKLRRFDPAVDTQLTALTDPAGAGGAITTLDMSLAHERTTFWMGYGRVGPLTRIHGFDVDGTETHDFAGPAVLADFVTIFTEATLTATVRIHFACIINGTGACNMSTYLGATSALQTNTPAMFAAVLGQIGMCAASPVSTIGRIIVTLPQVVTGNPLVAVRGFINSTHVTTGLTAWDNALANSKLLNVRGRAFFASTIQDTTAGARTHFMVGASLFEGGSRLIMPQCAVDRLVASACSIGQLPNLAFDAATGHSYWARATLTEAGVAVPVISECDLASTDRKQSVNLGDVLYVSGGIIHAFDGRVCNESGFLTTPRVQLPGGVVGAGALTLLGTYQIVAVFETFDSKGRRIQSTPSDVVSVTLAGAQNTITAAGVSPHSLRYTRSDFGGFSPTNDVPAIVFYRTLNTANGNLTFFRDVTVTSAPQGASVNAGVSFLLSDAALSAREILYTQGARGSLSGPLPFIAPEPASSIAASADRILTGNLPAGSRIQESRPLFVAEQVNWSDEIGFERDTRGRVLAVVRLDERRIAFTATELFELDGPGLDDNGNGDIGAPRRLPSDVGLYGGVLGWRSVVECSLGIMFQGLIDQIYLLPRGGTTPQPIGMAVQDRLLAFPVISAAVYMAADQTVRFLCNNAGGTDSLCLLYDIVQQEWVAEGPYGAPTSAAAQYQDRVVLLQNNVVRQQRASHPPVALIANAWRSGSIHPFGLGQFGRVLNYQFYGEYRGDCTLRCIATYDDQTVETLNFAEVNAVTLFQQANANNGFISALQLVNPLSAGSPYSFVFTPNQMKCECVRVDWEVDTPFPNVVNAGISTQNTAVASINVTLASNRAIGDRMVVVVLVADSVDAATSAGWVQRATVSVAGSQRVTVLERTLDGTEVSPVAFAWTGGTAAAFVNHWTIRNSHPTAPIELAVFSPGVTLQTQSSNSVTPSWGLANTRWLAVLGLGSRTTAAASLPSGVNVQENPEGYRRGINSSVTSVTPHLSGQLEGGDVADRVAQRTPGPWSWFDPTTATTINIAIRPNEAIASEGLAYHYWTMDVDDAGKSALKSPVQMG